MERDCNPETPNFLCHWHKWCWCNGRRNGCWDTCSNFNNPGHFRKLGLSVLWHYTSHLQFRFNHDLPTKKRKILSWVFLIFLCRYVEEHIQRTGVAIETQGFTFITSGKKRESLTVRLQRRSSVISLCMFHCYGYCCLTSKTCLSSKATALPSRQSILPLLQFCFALFCFPVSSQSTYNCWIGLL